jgi:hypothetical protein
MRTTNQSATWKELCDEVGRKIRADEAMKLRMASLPWAMKITTSTWWIEGIGYVIARPTKWMIAAEKKSCKLTLACYIAEHGEWDEIGIG